MNAHHTEFDFNPGTVALVGAGPGDPELLTLKAARLLERADVVLYDHLVDDRILRTCRHDATLYFVGKVPDGPRTTQDEINRLLVHYAASNLRVVRLKGGDPFVFGRGGEESIALTDAGVPHTIVPGISSSIAVPASARIPVTHRLVANHFSVVTGMGASPDGRPLEESWSALAKAGGTLVFLMGVRKLPRIVEVLTAAGLSPDTPAAIVERGTTADERVLEGTLGSILEVARDASASSPATIIVGDAVALRHEMAAERLAPLEAPDVTTATEEVAVHAAHATH